MNYSKGAIKKTIYFNKLDFVKQTYYYIIIISLTPDGDCWKMQKIQYDMKIK